MYSEMNGPWYVFDIQIKIFKYIVWNHLYKGAWADDKGIVALKSRKWRAMA